MDKLQLSGQTWAECPAIEVYMNIPGVHAMLSHCFETKLLNLKLKARHKQMLGYLLLDITLQKEQYAQTDSCVNLFGQLLFWQNDVWPTVTAST